MSKKDIASPTVPAFAVQAVYLRESFIRMAPDFFPSASNTEFVPFHRVRAQSARQKKANIFIDGKEKTVFKYELGHRFEFVYVRPNDDTTTLSDDDVKNSTVAEIVAEIVVEYSREDSTEPLPAKQVRALIGVDAMFNSWPYWREYCHNTLVRMGLPVTTIPSVTAKQLALFDGSPDEQ